MKARIFIVEDHAIFREGLVSIINDEIDLVVCGEADDVAGALDGIEQAAPHLVHIDLKLKRANGLDLIKDIGARWPQVRTLVLSAYDEWYYADRVLRAGASGYVMKYQGSEVVLAAIRTVLRRGRYVSEAVKQRLLQYGVLPSLGEASTDRDGNNS